MKHKLLFISLFGSLLGVSPLASAAGAVPAAPEAEQAALRFAIDGYVIEGASLLSQAEIDAAVLPYVGKDKDFSDVQRALEAIENLYAKHGYSAVRVLLPEQELDKGKVRFRVVESRFGKVTVKDNHFVSEDNALNALPSVRSGEVPRSRQIGQELRLANENPARQMNVALKAGAKDDEVDASVIVTDSNPSSWSASLDNTGSPETGRTRLGIFYHYANLFDADHVANIQYLTSPEHTDRVAVFGASYKIPLYQSGNSLEFFAGYSNVNSLVGGLSNFQGGGTLFSTRYNFMLARVGVFDPRLSLGLDWRDFQRVEMIDPPPPIVLYNEIVVVPVSLTYAAQGKFARSEAGFSASLVSNMPGMSNGHDADFAAYDQLNLTRPEANYHVARYGANYSQLIGDGWQFRTVLNGQKSSDVLVQGEQMRLGGADAVRGFSEGSQGGETGARLNLEGYTPDLGGGDLRAHILVFYDAGQVTPANAAKILISSAGVGLRVNHGERFSLHLDMAQIKKAGTDPLQRVGDRRVHAGLNVIF